MKVGTQRAHQDIIEGLFGTDSNALMAMPIFISRSLF